jgi:flagellar biosynthetic protein FliR
MDDALTDRALLEQLPTFGFAFMLVLSRVGCACMLLPGVGEQEVPTTIRVGFAFAMTALLLPVLLPIMPPAPIAATQGVGMIVAEVVTGLWLGWITRLVLLALPLAGQIAASMLGIANVLQPNTALGAQSTALSHLLGLAAPVAVLAGGLYAMPLAALQGSYRLIPPGALLPAADGASSAMEAVGACFAVALRLSAPFVLAGTVWQVALGLLARLVPQLQVYFAALPGQILGGVLLLAMLAGPMMVAWQDHAATAFATLPAP